MERGRGENLSRKVSPGYSTPKSSEAAGENMSLKKNPLKSIGVWSCFLHGRSPGQVVIQYTDKCNALCAQCGMRASNDFPRTKMDPEKLKPQIEAMAQKGVQSISFTGGEPLLFLDEVIELANFASKAGIPYIRTGTNGFIFRGSKKPGFMSRISTIAENWPIAP